MNPIYIVLIIISSLILLVLLTSYICFKITFFVPNKDKIYKEYDLPPGDMYIPYHETMIGWMKEMKSFNQEVIKIKSYDGLTLYGIYYEFFKGAPVEIMFHGYRGSAERDLCGGLQRCKELKRNVLAVDQRGHGRSDGNIISFGIKERYDVQSWANYAYDRFGDSVKLIITGISMGSSTVTMASSLELPKTVVGVVADCGYSSAKEIIKIVVKQLKLSPTIFYPFIKLGALIFGGFNLEETSPEQEVKKSKLPTIFLHGDKDDFVPCEMSNINYNACQTPKDLQIFEGAGHGMCYLVDPDRYVKVLADFEKNHLSIE